jgi:hypothetical protein
MDAALRSFCVKWWVLLAVLANLAGTELAALTVTVTAGGRASLPPVVIATLRRVDGEAPVRLIELPTGQSAVINDVAAAGTWEIVSTSPSFWAAPVYALGSEAVTLQLWPLGSIRGKLRGQAPASGELVVHFVPSTDEAGPAGVIVCPFVGRDWTCSLPDGTHDVKFSVPGYATEFRWGLVVAGNVDIGSLELIPGSSVSGKVLTQNSANVLKSVEVLLNPFDADAGRGRIAQFKGRPDARGFFQIRGLAPGTYNLQARAVDLISETRIVEIIQGTNASLKEPLLLAKPTRVSVHITPWLDPQGKRWHVMLVRSGAAAGEVIDRSVASPQGEWSLKRVLPGEYELMIQQDDGAEWKHENFVLRAGEEDRSIDLVLISQRVSGQITLGQRPIAATVRFGDENGPALIADENGRFEGAFPPLKEGETPLLVTSHTPDVQRSVAVRGEHTPDGDVFFKINLPATTINGRTINEDGSPEPLAIVTLRSTGDDGRAIQQMFSEKDGVFQFEGFEPGKYALQADAFQKASAVVSVDVSTDGSSSIDLILRPQEEVRGRIAMNGFPVAGADVYALPRDTHTTLLPKGRSDDQGMFVVTLPPGTKTYDAIVIPRGFYVTAARITRVPKEGLNVSVGQDGGSLTVDAPADDTMLLLVHAGGEYSLSWLTQAAGGTTSVAAGRRRLTIPNLESGQYSVCRKQTCQSTYVPRFANAVVTVDK